MIPKVDFHIHSQFSPCSKNKSIHSIISVAEAKGLRSIAVTDHGTTRKPSWFNRYLSEVEWARKNTEIDVLTGMEVDIGLDGHLVVDDDILEELDVVIGSLHYLPSNRNLSEQYFTTMTRAMEVSSFNIFAHPTYLTLGRIRVPSHVAESIIPKLGSKGIVVEMNYHHLDPSPRFLRECVIAGVKIIPSSDAHKLEEIGHFEWFEKMATEVGKDITWGRMPLKS